jgi:hypothetical protein
MKFCKGDIVVPGEAQFPEGALIVDGYDAAGRLLAHPMGGGMQYVFGGDSSGQFRRVDEGEPERVLFRPGKFSLMDEGELFAGWANGLRWNGFAMPHFELAEAQRLIVWLAVPEARFEAERDAFVTVTTDGEEEVWEAMTITITDGTRIKVYPVGAGGWCWDDED